MLVFCASHLNDTNDDIETVEKLGRRSIILHSWRPTPVPQRRHLAPALRPPLSAGFLCVRGVRRLVVTNYPYVVYYEVAGDQVIILSILHASADE